MKVDIHALKTGMVATIALLILAFIFNAAWLVAFVAVAQALAALDAPFGPYRLLYRCALLPTDLLQPKIIDDDPVPHRFASAVGALFNGGAIVALWAGVPLLGWLLVGVVVVLANINFWLNFCLGCWMYLQLARLRVPGFRVRHDVSNAGNTP
jgi:hypothetical protein